MRYIKDSEAVISRGEEAAGNLCRFTGLVEIQLGAIQLLAHSFHLGAYALKALAFKQQYLSNTSKIP